MHTFPSFSHLKTAGLDQACKAFHVRRLYVFGSAASGNLSDGSDLDFLVAFNRQGYQQGRYWLLFIRDWIKLR